MTISRFSLVLAIGVASSTWAQDLPTPQSDSPAVELKNKMMYFKIGGAWRGTYVYQGDKQLKLGAFGSNADAYFAENPESLAYARSFRTQSIVGVSLWTAGIAGVLGSLGYLVGASASGVKPEGGVYAGLFLGGVALEVAGGIVMSNAAKALGQAVNTYNASLLNRYLPPEQKIDFKLFLGMNQRGVGLAYHF